MKCPHCSFDPTSDSDFCSEHNQAARVAKQKLQEAAPDMAEALRNLVAITDAQMEQQSPGQKAAMKRARAALAKAGL